MADAAPFNLAEAYEVLVQFLYQVPVGLAQVALDGEIVLANPTSVQLLTPMCADGKLSNLFVALAGVAPGLLHLVAGHTAGRGMICEGLRIPLEAGPHAQDTPRLLSLSLLKVDTSRLIAVLTDITRHPARAAPPPPLRADAP